MGEIQNKLSQNGLPDVSFIMPCFNEQEVVAYTVQRLFTAFDKAGYHLELIAIDNGSSDKTGEILQELASEYQTIICHRVEVNEGYGNGVLRGISLCTAPWVGIIPADGEVDAEDVVRLYEAAALSKRLVLAKVRRRFRMDGLRRKVVSTTYNLFVRMLWPGLNSLDINGSPKLMPRRLILGMNLKSKGWLLDPEMMIKAYYLGVPVLEFNIFARLRGGGTSHVRLSSIWEFLKALLIFRFSSQIKEELNLEAVQVGEEPNYSL